MSMRAAAAGLMAVSFIAVAATGCSRQPPADIGCSAGRGQYDAQDVALRLSPEQNIEGRYRLPLGKVVVTWYGVCATGTALQAAGTQTPPSTQFLSESNAFRAVHLGTAYLSRPYICGEACQRPVIMQITVTDGCQLVSRGAVAQTAAPQYPLPPPRTVSTKLIYASQYEQLFGTRLSLQSDTQVWAVLIARESEVQPSPPSNPPSLYWEAVAVDACTDWVSHRWSGSSPPAGWDTVADQSPPGA